MERSRTLAVRAASGLAMLAAVLVAAGWTLRGLSVHRSRALSSFSSIGDLAGVKPEPWEMPVLIGAAALVVALLAHRRALLNPRAAAGVITLVALMLIASTASPLGFYALIAVSAILLALLVALHLPAPRAAERAPDGRNALLLWIGLTAIACVFSMHRYWAFGAGSWDLGCMIHNFYRASRFLDTRSTVLGDVDFLGDHFMLGIYLYAPLVWLSSSGYMHLFIQSANMAAVGPAIYLIARGRGAGPWAATCLALAAGLSFGVQSAVYFDSHEIAVGFGFLAFGVWAFESRRFRLATALLVIFALFKESLGAYVVGIGLLAAWRGLRDGDPRSLRYGAAWIGAGALIFVVVNRLLMPWLIARGNAPEPHETFGDFGPTVFLALKGILLSPLRAIVGMFVPEEKRLSMMVTFGGVGYLAIASPEILLAAAPLFAERFLSSKATMWEMGYHYAASLCFYAAWAAAIAWPRLARGAARLLDRGGPGLGAWAPAVLGTYLLASAILIDALGYRHPSNYLRWDMDYFSRPEKRAANARAVKLVRGLGRDVRIAAQNRILPHLADREVVYRLGDWEKADFVVLSEGENAWPWDDGFPQRLAAILGASPEWRRVFAENGTVVFARAARTDLPAAVPNG